MLKLGILATALVVLEQVALQKHQVQPQCGVNDWRLVQQGCDMLLSYLYPFPIRNLPAPILWVFYRQLGRIDESEVAYVGSPEYFADPASILKTRAWEMNPSTQTRLGFHVPEAEQVARARTYVIDPSLFDPLLARTTSGIRAWAWLMTTEFPPLSRRLEEIFRQAADECSIEAVLTFCNCASLRKVAAQFGVPVIHNELGALRAPLFHPTVYFDFQGVNGNTESAKRYRQFRSEVDDARTPLLSKQELLREIMSGPTFEYTRSLESTCEYELGIPLQVEDDSNLIAYGNGYSNYELIVTAFQFFPVDRVLVRPHPNGSLDYRKTAWKQIHIDESQSSIDFIKRCKRIITINSSIALESMLLDVPTCILGYSPFDFFADGDFDQLIGCSDAVSQEHVIQLNFAVLAYLTPEPFLFDISYYRWRLRKPSELEIYRFHLNYYRAIDTSCEPDLKVNFETKLSVTNDTVADAWGVENAPPMVLWSQEIVQPQPSGGEACEASA